VSSMERATDRIASGRFDTTIGIARADELGRLSSAIERMASRLGALVTGQKRFLGDTAHELRSPLGRMQLALEILNTRVGDSERPYVRDLKEDVDALSALTDDLLQYARAELTEQPIQTTRVDVSEAIDRVVARESNGAQFDVQVPRGLHAIADAKLLERALANVCRNAATYAGAAGPIEVRAARDGGSIAVTVSDRGPGVAPESLTRIFEPFFREDRARNRKTGGTGLGLAITRSAVEACGGTVGTELRQPHGLTVRLAFPASTAAPSSSPQTAPGGRSAMR
jgi:two-component system, OmpR family, sensor histidine kinase CpxA